MASVADRRRRRRQRTVSLARSALARAPDGPAAGTPTAQAASSNRAAGAGSHVAHEDGVTRLRAKGRLTARQVWAARTYGAIERTAALPDGASIRSFLEIRPRGGASSGLPPDALAGPAWVAECRWRLADAHQALNWHQQMIGVLGLVCGRGLHPREISPIQREAEAAETVLIVGLDQLVRHWREVGFQGVGAWT